MSRATGGGENWVALLGVKGGPAIRPGSALPTSSLLALGGRLIVVDCGLGVTRGLVGQGMSLSALEMIFITHLHSDHYLELGPLLHTAWTAGLKTPVRVFGPEGVAQYWQAFLVSMQADIDLRMADEGRPDLRALIQIHVLEAGLVVVESGLEVQALRNIHPPLVETFALSFAADGHRVVFSGDTAFHPPLAEFAHGADLLIHEAMLETALDALFARIGNGDDRLRRHWMRAHTTAQDAARLAELAGVKALALNHLIPSDDPGFGKADWLNAVRPHWQGPLHLGHDGMRIAIGTAA